LFRHPLGLAAGFDKSAQAIGAWPALGFSWVEYGGVTRYPQDGNPKPRMFRSNRENALINRMGFNNPGAQQIRDTLTKRQISGKWPNVPIAANIGRSKIVNNERAPDDYAETFGLLYDHADIFVLNVSSPNTPGLRELQEDDLLSCAGAALSAGIDGFIATNTTISRPAPKTTSSRQFFAEQGGLSGKPLHDKSIQMIGDLYDSIGGKVPIVGCGGIDSGNSAWNAITNGSSLLQLYSAMVFQGPSVVKRVTKGLKAKMENQRFADLQEAVGYTRP
jgi:dihydroorotate dehydrogenase